MIGISLGLLILLFVYIMTLLLVVSSHILIVASSTHHFLPNSNDLTVFLILASSDVIAAHSTWGNQMSSVQLQMDGYYFMGVFKVTLSKCGIINHNSIPWLVFTIG